MKIGLFDHLERSEDRTLATQFDERLEFAAAADEAGLESRERSYHPDPIEGADDDYGAITVQASFRGRYEQLVNLLHRLDHSEEFLIIGALGATPRSDSNDLQITMRIDTFVRNL